MLIVALVPLFSVGGIYLSRSISDETARYRTDVVNSLKWLEHETTRDIDALRLQGIRLSLEAGIIAELGDSVNWDESSRYRVEKILFSNSLSLESHSTCVFTREGHSASNTGSTKLIEVVGDHVGAYREMLRRSTRMYLWGDPILFEGEWLLPYLRFIYGADKSEPIGLLVQNYPVDLIRSASAKQMAAAGIRTEDVLLVNGDTILSSWDGGLIGTSLSALNGGGSPPEGMLSADYGGTPSMYIEYANEKVTDWRYIAVIARSEVYAAGYAIVRLIAAVALLCIAFIVLASLLVSRNISRPLRYLSGAMVEIGNKNLNAELKNPRYHDEVGRMWLSLIEMTEMLKRYQAETKAAWEENKRLYYEALKAQINPHFLYNTFSSVIALIDSGHPGEATEMLVALADLLHISISRTTEFVTVEQELNLIRRYMEIQKVRFGKGFQSIIDVDMDIMKLHTVKIMLQPVVENALEHGLAHCEDGRGMISIRGRREGDLLVFEVADNGGGLSDERMREVNDMLRGPRMPPSPEFGIGLKNVNDRIRYEFPGDDRVGVTLARSGNNTLVRIATKATEKAEDGTIRFADLR
ncbi:MAG: sensor histidine kinase [Clostridiales bacterium]|nr:sensor histidine kinase [Clostridiales bacterium]